MAHTTPALFLHGAVNIDYATDFNSDPLSPAFGAAFKWAASVFVNPQAIGVPLETYTFAYDGSNVKVGDWIASSEFGRALRVAEITSAATSTISLVLEDVDSYNALTDTTGTFDGSIPSSACVVFTLNEFGFPVLGPLNESTLPSTAQGNILARFNYVGDYTFPGTGGGGGGSDFLGEPTDGTYEDGAVKGWVPGITKKDDAIDDLNRFLLRALPERPKGIADIDLIFENQPNGIFRPFITVPSYSWKLAKGDILNYVPEKTFNYKDPITPVDSILITTTEIKGVGDGDLGELSFSVNGTLAGSRVLQKGSDIGSYSGLAIIDDYAYPEGTFGVWEALDVRVTANVLDGINEVTLSHTKTGSTSETVVVESFLASPVITNATFNSVALETVYSSGVPHATVASTFKTEMTVENMVGRSYVASEIAGTYNDVTGFVTSITGDKLTDDVGIEFVINLEPTALSWTSLLPATKNWADTPVDFFALNSFRESRIPTGKRILIASDFPNPACLYDNPPFEGVQDGLKRIVLLDGDCPSIASVAYAQDWDSGYSGSLGDLKLWEAPIVGGIATANQTNYSVNYIPVGPDFSTKPATQYLTYKSQMITNRLKLSIDGTYTKLFIKLPGVANEMPNAVNGWWNATKQADNAPLDWPGHANNGDGCLMNKTDDVVEITFGNISSAASSDNVVLIRFVLTGTDAIRSIKILD